MIWAIVFGTSIPLWVQIFNDARGERRKANDLIVLIPLAGIIVWLGHIKAHYHWIGNLALTWAWHFMFFDYLINIALVLFGKREFVAQKKWWTYLGSGPIDMLWKHWDWRLRLGIRVANLIICIFIFLTLNNLISWVH